MLNWSKAIRVLAIVYLLFLIALTIATWLPVFWSQKVFFLKATPFEESWSNLAVDIYLFWLISLFTFLGALICHYKDFTVKIVLFVGLAILFVAGVFVGGLLHMCSLGVDCI
jgi:hypothetical protein